MTKKRNPKIKYEYNRERALKLLLDKSAYEDREDIVADIKITETFIDSAFNDFEGINKLDSVEFAFCIPTRASRFNEGYWQEVYDFLPGLKHIDIHTRYAILASMPPFKVELYGKPGKEPYGVVVFVPIFNDMLKDYRNKLLLRREVTRRINDATDLAHNKMGAKYIGLGATLPKLTDFGRKIKARVITTTGHGGTVWLMQRTFSEVVDKYFDGKHEGLKVGFIGAGSIGLSALENITQEYENLECQIYDIRPKMNQDAQKHMRERGVNLKISKSNDDLIKECDIILSAITSKIDISGTSLSGKVIIDDSQPGQFSRREVQKAGGVLVWVVGNDSSSESFATRKNEYSYGPTGLHSPHDLWGCEAEVAAIARLNRPDLAIRDNVTTEQVKQIGEVFEQLGIKVAEFQSYGLLNNK